MNSKALKHHFACISSKKVDFWYISINILSRPSRKSVGIVCIERSKGITEIRKQQSPI